MLEIEPEFLRDLLCYEPDTGRLFWEYRLPEMFTFKGGHTVEHTCAKWNAAYAGTPAFTYVMSNGYLQGNIFGKLYLAHRVAWAIQHGEWPSTLIDHEDRDKRNNRIKNLRLATKSQNAANTGSTLGGSSQFRGVCWSKAAEKWVAYISHDKKRKHLGTFADELSAAKAYDAAAISIFGKFAAPNFMENPNA